MPLVENGSSSLGADERRRLHGRCVTSLMYACQQNRDGQVRELLAQNKSQLIRQRDRTMKSALHYCVENSSSSSAELVLAAAPELLDARDRDGFTPLHLAIIAGNLSLVRFLLHKRADLTAVDNEKHSLVHWATVCGEVEALEALLEAGADPCMPDIHNGYPIHYAAQMCGANSEMGTDAKVGIKMLGILLARKISVNVVDSDGRQPILWAASAGSADAVLSLINAGAEAEAADKDGLTALHCAASRGHTECLETLVTLCGADANVIDNHGCTALFYAVTLGHADCTQLLLNFGADYDTQDRRGRTAAHCGAAKGQLETLRLLHAAGADLWKRNVRGELPLHDAVQSGRRELVRWLLALRPDMVAAANSDGCSCLHIAAIKNYVEMCRVLLDAESFVNPVMRTSKGALMTPLDAALAKGNRSCAKYLQLLGGVPASKLTEEAAALRGQTRANLDLHSQLDSLTPRLDASPALLMDTSGFSTPAMLQLNSLEVPQQSSRLQISSNDELRQSQRSARRPRLRKSKSPRGSSSDSEKEAEQGKGKRTRRKSRKHASKADKKAERQADLSDDEDDEDKSIKTVDGQGDVERQQHATRAKETRDRASVSKSQKQKTSQIAADEEQASTDGSATEETEIKPGVEPTKNNAASDAMKKEKTKTRNVNNKTGKWKTSPEKSDKSKSRPSESQKQMEESSKGSTSIQQQMDAEDSKDSGTASDSTTIEATTKVVGDTLKDKIETKEVARAPKLHETGKSNGPKGKVENDESPKDKIEMKEVARAPKLRETGKSNSPKDKVENGESRKAEVTEKVKKKSVEEEVIVKQKKAETTTKNGGKKTEAKESTSSKPENSETAEKTKKAEIISPSKHEEKEKKHVEEASDQKPENKKTDAAKEIIKSKGALKTSEDTTAERSKSKGDEIKVSTDNNGHREENGTKQKKDGKPGDEMTSKLVVVNGKKGKSEDAPKVEGAAEVKSKKSEAAASPPKNNVEVKVVPIKSESANKRESNRAGDERNDGDSSKVAVGAKSKPSRAATEEHQKSDCNDEGSHTEPKSAEGSETHTSSALTPDATTLSDSSQPEERVSEGKLASSTQVGQTRGKQQRPKSATKEQTTSCTSEAETTDAVTATTEGIGASSDSHSDHPSDSNDGRDNTEVKKEHASGGGKENGSSETEDAKTATEKARDTVAGKNGSTAVKGKPKHQVHGQNLEPGTAEPSRAKKEVRIDAQNEHKQEEGKSSQDGGKAPLLQDSKAGQHKHSREKPEKAKSKPPDDESQKQDENIKGAPSTHQTGAEGSKQKKEVFKQDAEASEEQVDELKSKTLKESSSDEKISAPTISVHAPEESKQKTVHLENKDNHQGHGALVIEGTKQLINGKPSQRVPPLTKAHQPHHQSVDKSAQIEEDEKKAREIIRRRHEQSVVSVTQAVQVSTRKYQLERRIFQELLELKKAQLRVGRGNESVVVKRAVDEYRKAGLIVGLRQYDGPYAFRAFEQYLYDQLKLLQNSADARIIARLKPTDDVNSLAAALRLSVPRHSPAFCTVSTHRCNHATDAYTNAPVANYVGRLPQTERFLPEIDSPKKDKPSFASAATRTLRHVDIRKPMTLELSLGGERQVIALPTEKLDKSKRYFVSFSIKPKHASSAADVGRAQTEDNNKHQHASTI